jgi:cold-inducible RNA-binding protein
MQIYVGNLSYSTGESQIQALFAPHGVIENVQVIMDKFTGRSRGFGFVTMPNDQEALAAIAALDGKELEGRTLKINEARPREEGGGARSGSRSSRRPFRGGSSRREGNGYRR